MPQILRARPRRGLVATAVTVALIAAACGSDAEETSQAAGDTAAGDTESTTGVDRTGESSESDESAGTEAADREAAPGSADEPADPGAAPIENFFPDLEVVNVADGSTLNLAEELGGGDRPVLLWFWAPH